MATHRRLGSVSALAHIDCKVLKMMLEFADALLPSRIATPCRVRNTSLQESTLSPHKASAM